MQKNTNARPDNKGFTIHLGDNYIGYVVIGEKNVPEETLKNLQDPVKFSALAAQAEFRPFAEKADTDMSDVDDILNSVTG